jgi:insertion element IS1 protein InsB
MICESASVLSIARILKISINTLQANIKRAGKATVKPPIGLYQQSIEVDELRTFIGDKENQYWLKYGTNRMERKNLSIRTDIRQLSRRTIRFRRSRVMLENRLKIYFWGAGK